MLHRTGRTLCSNRTPIRVGHTRLREWGIHDSPLSACPRASCRSVNGRNTAPTAGTHIYDAVSVHGKSAELRALVARAARFLGRRVETVRRVYARRINRRKRVEEFSFKLRWRKSLAAMLFENSVSLLKDIH